MTTRQLKVISHTEDNFNLFWLDATLSVSRSCRERWGLGDVKNGNKEESRQL
jgi:hypothetical protein